MLEGFPCGSRYWWLARLVPPLAAARDQAEHVFNSAENRQGAGDGESAWRTGGGRRRLAEALEVEANCGERAFTAGPANPAVFARWLEARRVVTEAHEA